MIEATKPATGTLAPPPSIGGADAPDRRRVEAVQAANQMARVAGRRIDTPIRKTFVRNLDDTGRPPMAVVYAGGRSGVVALKVYLALVWRSTKAPHSSALPSRGLATLLGLPDPEGKGSRRVTAALKRLEEYKLITLTPQPGHPTLVTLLDESADGGPYEVPSTAYAKRSGKKSTPLDELRRHRYFKVDSRLWLSGKMQDLSGPGLVMLLILLAEQAGEGKEVWFSTTAFHDRYGIAHQTRATGTTELLEAGLLSIEKRSLGANMHSSTFDPRRTRTAYRLFGEALLRPEAPSW